ncbi:TPA: hypothetical protein ACX3IQ_004038 [Vibrio parahaemolyticus]|uniref:hypothetical protein n=1 Tax=Vibrio TaxID=662 RepID=UPI00148C63D3|nr:MULTISPECIES: hypothetical protein [Vibrio]MDW1755297.1 hypothetical protein [Vibrio sp. Vb2535]MDW1954236.1 hypothetical protein [Vibrio sp. Vb0562]NOI45624.1 hypothetical protein [Vibrio alginolyticus]
MKIRNLLSLLCLSLVSVNSFAGACIKLKPDVETDTNWTSQGYEHRDIKKDVTMFIFQNDNGKISVHRKQGNGTNSVSGCRYGASKYSKTESSVICTENSNGLLFTRANVSLFGSSYKFVGFLPDAVLSSGSQAECTQSEYNSLQ